MTFFSRIFNRTFTSQAIQSATETKLVHETLVKDLFRTKNHRELVQNFKKHSESDLFRRTRAHMYNKTVMRLANAKKFSLVEEILEDQKKYDDIKAEGFAVRIISLYGKAGLAENALQTFEQLPELKCEISITLVNAVLSAHVRSKKFKEAETLFNDLMERFKLTPDNYSYNILIGVYCGMGELDKGIAVLDKMEENGVKPDVITYGAILNEIYKTSESFSKADEIWEIMKKSEVDPNGFCCNSKVMGLIRKGEFSEANKFLEEMEKVKGAEPNSFTYNLFVRGYINNDYLNEAKRIIDIQLEKNLLDWTSITDIVPFLLEKAELDKAIEVINKGLDMKLFVKLDNVQAVVDALVKASEVTKAEMLIERAKGKNKGLSRVKMPASSTL